MSEAAAGSSSGTVLASCERQNWGTERAAVRTTGGAPQADAHSCRPPPPPRPASLSSQSLTGQGLLGEVLDVHVLVLCQLLQDGLDLALQRAEGEGEGEAQAELGTAGPWGRRRCVRVRPAREPREATGLRGPERRVTGPTSLRVGRGWASISLTC